MTPPRRAPVGIYTGAGSRDTPPEIQSGIVALAGTLRVWGWIMRTGHAPGADQAFERGAREAAEIYLPWSTYEAGVRIVAAERHACPTVRAYELAEQYHPAWDRCSQGARALHARNVHELLGINCDDPSGALVCFTRGARGQGGTGQAIRIARAYGVPVFDLGRPGAMPDALKFFALAPAESDDARL